MEDARSGKLASRRLFDNSLAYYQQEWHKYYPTVIKLVP